MPNSRYAVTAVATTAIAAAVQVAAWRLAGHPVPPALLASHLLAAGAVHLAAALALGGFREGRAWSGSLLLLPPLFAALPALDRAGGTAAVLAAGGGGALLILAASRWGRAPGRPLLSALLGAVSGAAVAAACRGLQLESPPHTPGPGMKLFLALLALLTVAMLCGPKQRAARPRPAVSLGIAALALAAAAATSRPGLPRPLPDAPGRTGAAPPIVLIVLDTLRADHLRSYGYGRDTMPRLERFARENAVRIERATSNAPSSLETHGSIFTGLLPHRHGAHKPRAGDPRPPAYGYALRPDVPTLALLLRRAGYWPVGISANFGPLSPEFGLSRGFGFYEARSGLQRGPALYDPFRFALWRRWPLASLDRLPPFAESDFFELGVPYRRAGEIADRALEALDRAGGTPLFLFLNFMEPHYPYRPPRSFTRIFPGIRRPGLRRLDDDQAAAQEIMAGRRI
ncbi:MAG TPA: sulfatase-like hydrolase/transferase, partial [Thermoanaerobaculia bacterium]|nr:sulfatase-like hydrolase/transferase [Thermoanaerobaculia bacterium]